MTDEFDSHFGLKNKKDMKNILEIDESKYLKLERGFRSVLNELGIDSQTNTPDFLLADYLIECLKTYASVNYYNQNWHRSDSNPFVLR